MIHLLPEISTLNITLNRNALCGLNILHLSDLHFNQKTTDRYVENLLAKCHSIPYDFIVITGDIIDTNPNKIIYQLQLLNKLQNVYYISGNHDIFYGLPKLKKLLNNFTFLDNQIEKFVFKNKEIYLLGLADRFSKFFHIPREVDTLLELAKGKENIIFLAHQPKDYQIALQANASLFLCGHTHGGQIFPFHYLVKLVQPYLSGLHYKKKMAIYVNSGLGTWGVHHRFKAPSEITLLKLS